MEFLRKKFSMDREWKFSGGEVDLFQEDSHNVVYAQVKAGGAFGPARKKAYDDSAWQIVNLPRGFSRGWRELRIPVELPEILPENGVPSLEFASVICDRMEIYLDGELIFEAAPEFKESVSVPLRIRDRRAFELRCLLLAKSDSAVNGVGGSLTLSVLEE